MDSNEAEDQESLGELQRSWHNLGHALKAAEHLWEHLNGVYDAKCDALGENTMCAGASFGLVCAPNPPKLICSAVKITVKFILYLILVGVTVSYQAVDDIYDIATLGEHLCCLMSHISITY